MAITIESRPDSEYTLQDHVTFRTSEFSVEIIIARLVI